MKIYLCRHGQTTGDIEDRYGGDYDDHLTAKGKQQSQELAEMLKGKEIQKIYHSPLHRATETAEILSNLLEAPAEAVAELKERNNYGILTGRIKAEALKDFPEAVKELSNGLYHHVPNSEPYLEFEQRVTDAFLSLANKNFEAIAIVSHGGPISCIVREVLKQGELKVLGECACLEIENMRLISLYNCSFNVV